MGSSLAGFGLGIFEIVIKSVLIYLTLGCSILPNTSIDINTVKYEEDPDDEGDVTYFCPNCGKKLNNLECDNCKGSLSELYNLGQNYCVNCGINTLGNQKCLYCCYDKN